MSKALASITISMGLCLLLSVFFWLNDSASLMAIFGIFAVILFLAIPFYNTYKAKTLTNDFIKTVNDYVNKNNIHVSKSVISDTKTSYIIFDHENNNIHILRHLSNSVTLPYSLIIESELNENGDTVMKSNRASQVAGAIIGGAIASGAGAIIGGLSGKKTSSEMIKDLEIKIVSNDINHPVTIFPIKDTELEVEKKSEAYRSLYNSAYELQKIISLIIKKDENAI